MRFLIAAGLTALLAAGCAGAQRDAYVRERASEYVYDQPLAKVWPHVRALLQSQGYVPLQTASSRRLVTEWKQDGAGGSEPSWSRYMVIGNEADGRCVVRFLKNSRRGEAKRGVGETDKNPVLREDAAGNRSETVGKFNAGEREGEEGFDPRPTEAATSDSLSAQSSRGPGKEEKVSGIRDLTMEWLLLQRAAPEVARRIYEDSKEKFR